MIEMQHFVTRLKSSDNTYKELFIRYPNNPILTAKDWPYAVNSVFNPAATAFGDGILLFARVEDRRGFSHFTKAISSDGVTNWKIDSCPTLEANPDYPEEEWGIEDPRITRIDELNRWAVVYTSFSRSGPTVSLALTKDFESFEKMGSIMPPEDKDAALFPRRFKNRWLLIHRPIGAHLGSVTKLGPGAHIWVSCSSDLKYWGDHKILINARNGGWWDANKVGLSAQPLETPDGWLLLYHGVRQTASGAIYRLGLSLLDLEDPFKVLHRSDEWIFGPQEQYEKEGDVSDVVFPCGWVLDKTTRKVRMYYGGADTCICLATASLDDLLEYIKSCPEPEPLK
jgi:predicted GH43/DUF377 family glycosyl hydrolase